MPSYLRIKRPFAKKTKDMKGSGKAFAEFLKSLEKLCADAAKNVRELKVIIKNMESVETKMDQCNDQTSKKYQQLNKKWDELDTKFRKPDGELAKDIPALIEKLDLYLQSRNPST